MKKILAFSIVFLSLFSANAQSEKYMKSMEILVAATDTTRSTPELLAFAAAFERIGDAEKTQWLPYYYAALAHANAGLMMSSGGMSGGMTDELDPIADKSEALLNKAEALSKNNTEIYIVKKMIATLRLIGDPMSRFMKYGPIAAEALAIAKKLDPENPRVYLLEGQDKLFTPEEYGGSKTEAKKLLELALNKFDAFKPASTISPSWGRNTTMYFLGQIK